MGESYFKCLGKLNVFPTDWYAKSEICSYENNSIENIWKNNFYSDLRDRPTGFLKCEFSNKFCKQCQTGKIPVGLLIKIKLCRLSGRVILNKKKNKIFLLQVLWDL